jgi:phospholipase D1/2
VQIDPRSTRHARWSLLAVVAGLVAAGALAWRYSPLSELTDPQRLADSLQALQQRRWAPLAALAIYVVAGAIEFPVVLLIAATALVFEPATAFAVALGGSLASSLVFYAAGARFARRTLRVALGPTLERAQALLARGGIVTIVVLRSIPLAPFTVVNLAAGSIGVPLREYVPGTALGLLPGIVLMTAFGDRLRAMWEAPTPRNLAVLVTLAILWIALVVGLQRVAARMRIKRPEATSSS